MGLPPEPIPLIAGPTSAGLFFPQKAHRRRAGAATHSDRVPSASTFMGRAAHWLIAIPALIVILLYVLHVI
jgi:hypothetical protein